MNSPAEKQSKRLMRQMFGEIAPRYDFVTRIFSYGMDSRWKRQAVARAPLPSDALVLDLACGTGDFSKLVLEKLPQSRPVAADLTEPMLRLARQRGIANAVCADAEGLPFADAMFDCVFVGYGLRNFPHLSVAVQEIARVLRPGGCVVTLDFFLPANPILRRLYLGILYAQGGFWGLLLHGRPRTYTYIPDSLRGFMSMDDFSALLRRSGFARVDQRPYLFGGIALHWAIRN
jgi:demethylmenaquinone methyltransferase / 2-methoxy-6-polyprenyl-1,4-benzoquinol methylase